MPPKQVQITDPIVEGEPQAGAMFSGSATASFDNIEGMGDVFLFGVVLDGPDPLEDLRVSISIADADFPPAHSYPPVGASVPSEFSVQAVDQEASDDPGHFVLPAPLLGFPHNPYFLKLSITNGSSEAPFLFYFVGREIRNSNLENAWFSSDSGNTWQSLVENQPEFEEVLGSTPDTAHGIPVVVQQVNGKSIPAFLTDGEQGDPIGETNPLFVTVTNPGEEATTTEINVDGDAVSNAAPFPVKVVSDESAASRTSVAAASDHTATVQGPSDTDLTDTISAGASQVVLSAYCSDLKAGAYAHAKIGVTEINVPINGAPVVVNAPDGLTLPAVTLIGHCEAANTEAVFFVASALRFD